jgi:threonine dehydrogenase-like Zn-dependent dehydrogenase
MKALVFGAPKQELEKRRRVKAAIPQSVIPEASKGANWLLSNLAISPVALMEVPDARPLRADWVVTKPLLAGICGSDSKQVLLDFGEDDLDSPLMAFCSFPQILGHEVVAEVIELGPKATGLEEGQRVVLNPWLTCLPRGLPSCPACRAGDLSLCWSFTKGEISPGLHTGVSRDATGGFAELMPAHCSMLFVVPEELSDEEAVLADPVSVSLHSITRHPPSPDAKCVVYGAGALGLAAIGLLRALYPTVEIAAVARFRAQQQLAKSLGASLVVDSENPLEVIEILAKWSGGVLHPIGQGLPMTHPGGVDVVYDTIGKPETLAVGSRVLKSRGTLVKSGVHAPSRWEWSPLYFKEITYVGSNAFGMETVEGKRAHAIEHYLDLVKTGRIDFTPIITHYFSLEDWELAFSALAVQGQSGAVKVLIDHRTPSLPATKALQDAREP